MKFFLSTFLFCLASICAFAVPAKRVPFKVLLTNGDSLTVVMVGDENCHYLASFADGTPVVLESEGVYRLAPEQKEELMKNWQERLAKRNTRRLERKNKLFANNGEMRKAAGRPVSIFTGKKRGIVILADYEDKSMKPTSTIDEFKNMFNEKGYSKNDHIGSVHDYFYDQSYGQFDLEFDIYGPVKLSKPLSYYGKNDSGGNDMHVGEMTIEVCKLADSAYDINWKNYDWNDDDEVDLVFIIYAGYGEYAGAPSYTVWPHEFSLTECLLFDDGDGPVEFDGVTVDTYAMSCELYGASGSRMSGIGLACHEFSHCLGLMDTYDASYSGGFGMDAWDLMASGNNSGINYNGEVPCGFTAYERAETGWLTLKELDAPCDVENIPSLNDSPTAYVIYNDGNRNEYFIIENRQSAGWFQYVEDYTGFHGLLITHVDYDKQVWADNLINANSKHQRMTIIPAGKKYGTLRGGQYYVSESHYAAHLFPGKEKAIELTNTSHADCGGALFNNNTDGTKCMNKPITDIVESADGLISFKFMGGSTAIDDIRNVSDNDAEEWFTLDGIKIDKPIRQGIYIVRKNGKTFKIRQ